MGTVLIFTKKKTMATIKYINSVTGEEVQYGQHITFHKEKDYNNGYKYECTVVWPVINATIPFLIEKGYIVQKEVKDKEKREKGNKPGKLTLTDSQKLDLLAAAMNSMIDNTDKLLTLFEEFVKYAKQKSTGRN